MELTNRKLYFDTKKEIEIQGLEISNNEICQLLEKVNNFKNYTELTLNFDKKPANLEYFYQLKEKLFKGMPIQYILKEAPFIDLSLYVDERVLIPRVETEELALRTLNYIKAYKINVTNFLDMCTGSGCITLYLKSQLKGSEAYASDFSLDALEVAKINTKNLDLKINFVHGDKLNPFLKGEIKFDLLISNPPYVQNKEDIEEKVKKYEPMNAIYSEDGTLFYEHVFKHYKEIMNDKFIMAFEINYDQQERLTDLIAKYFKDDITFTFVKDIYDRTRFLFVFRGFDL